MRNYFLLIFSLLFFFTKVASQISFAPLGSKWYIYFSAECSGALNSETYFVREVVSDTTIMGKYCTVIKGVAGPTCADSFYIHQDVAKVFVFNQETQVFQMLYDFSAQVGDKWKIQVCDWVYNTDSMTITVVENEPDFQILDVIDESGNSNYSLSNQKIFKGIGGINNNPLLFKSIGAQENCEELLLCYYTPSIGIVHISGDHCEASATNEKNNSKSVDALVYPNPASSQFSIAPNQPFSKDNQLILFDATGKLVNRYQLSIGQQVQTFPLENMPNGLYFWILKDEQDLIGSGKLVIAN